LLKKYLHEPLLHFLLIGTLIFAFYYWKTNDISVDENTIVLTQVEITQFTKRWEKKHLRIAPLKEKQEFIDNAIYAKVMYKEALKMGLDKNDLIIRRRLVQKMEFISLDMAQLVEPTDKELLQYLHKHSTEFISSSKIDFLQIYIDPNKHRGNLQKDLDKISTLLQNSLLNTHYENIGDSLIFPTKNLHLSKSDVTRKFGKEFTQKLFSLKQNVWHKAIKSGYGLHFVFIQNKEEGKLPELEEVRTFVRKKWMTRQRDKTNKLFYENLKKNYKIEIQESLK